ncbi:hypothetical protein FACS1894132_00970 [Clostridia bacterium]|nr:hypothetical protein FACS1894132_00970 [Clostridia bacterium]
MADFLKISTPIQQREQINPTRASAGLNAVNNVNPNETPTRIIGVGKDENLHEQNNKFIDSDGKPTILMNLMKDPAVTVSFLKNIYMLQEIIKLLPMNTRTKTVEIEQLFASLLIKPEDISKEIKKQESASTAFRGNLFDFLRASLQGNSSDKMKYGVANLLKALNNDMSKKDILGAVSNNLQYLAENLKASNTLGSRLSQLSEAFSSPSATENFSDLKQQVQSLIKDIEGSILYNYDTSKLVSIINYNLSRFNTNTDYLMESVRNMLTLLDGTETKNAFLAEVHSFINNLQNGRFTAENSDVMRVLSDIIEKCASDDDIIKVNPESVDKIIHSLLSSPCNYTPLLHFIIPVEYMDMKSFAEIWINPNAEDEGGKPNSDKNIHMLIIFDIEGIGQFETELFVKGKKINLTLFCPQRYAAQFSSIAPQLRQCVNFSEYSIDEIKFEEMKETRSLIQVFKSLPYKRTGVDVRI